MEQWSFKASAPGSLMLLGEHAVLERKPALVCAVNKRITVELKPNGEDFLTINNEKLGTLKQGLKEVKLQDPFKYVLAAIITFKPHLKSGFDLTIESEFSDKIGFGSSAAVTAATVAVIAKWLFPKAYSETVLFQQAKKAILMVQETGSCSDLAASIYGGVICYQMEPMKVDKLPPIPELSAVYCGFKRPTTEVISIVKAAKKAQPRVFDALYRAIEICVKQAVMAIKQGDWPTLGQLFMHHQGLQSAMGVSNQILDTLVHQLCERQEILGAKISGSGLGDCVIGLGDLPKGLFPINGDQAKQGVRQLPVGISEQGLKYG